MVPGDGFWLVTVGLGIGGAAALLVTQPLTLFLVPGVEAGDPGSLAAVVVVLVVTALVAAIAPTRRGVRIEPMAALRED
jgi:hypothetical protein